MRRFILGDSDLEVSQFALGTLYYSFGFPVAELFDMYTELGGNFIDTAHCYSFWTKYGAGASEVAVANCVRRSGGADLVIGTKGGHGPAPRYRTAPDYLSPYRIRADIDDSLARLNRTSIDLYWLHRDDRRVPVSEIIDYLNEEISDGRIRYLGASNWSVRRIEQANEFAETHAKQGFVASQPEFSLGVLSRESDGMRSLSRADEIDWHRRTGFPVVAYASTAQGFFATGGDRGPGYHNEKSMRRLERARTLADRHRVDVQSIALAYLICQDFPVIPILGTSNPDHLRGAINAQNVELDQDELEWLTA